MQGEYYGKNRSETAFRLNRNSLKCSSPFDLVLFLFVHMRSYELRALSLDLAT